jgi:hypothetical protein
MLILVFVTIGQELKLLALPFELLPSVENTTNVYIVVPHASRVMFFFISPILQVFWMLLCICLQQYKGNIISAR